MLQQSQSLLIVVIVKFFQRVTFNIVDFQRQFTSSEIVALDLQRIQGVIDLSTNVVTLLTKFAHQVKAV